MSTITLIAALEDDLGDALARIASALRVPVLLAALLVLLATALELGRFLMELVRRGLPGGRIPLAALAHRAEADPANARDLARKAPSRPSEDAVIKLAAAASKGNDKQAAEHALADYELNVQRRLDRTRIIVRAGPAVGLMGTLIPLAPGLAALGRGDLPQLASDLRTAFAATVIGLLAGTVAFALTLTRTRMYSEDLTALERAAAAMGTPPPPLPEPEKPEPKAEDQQSRGREEAGGVQAMSRVGLGRHGRLDDSAGDPLDGLVNLFDLGIVLAVAFLVAGLSLTVNSNTGRVVKRQATPQDPPARPGPPAARSRACPRGQRPRRARRAGLPHPRRPPDLRREVRCQEMASMAIS